MSAPTTPSSRRSWPRRLLLLAVVSAATAGGARLLLTPHANPAAAPLAAALRGDAGEKQVAAAVDAAFAGSWHAHGVQPAPPADSLTIARRLALALTGSIPSLQEIRALESLAEEQRLDWWLAHLFADRRTSDYLAERFVRVFVGTDAGPFISFRRGRLNEWVANHLHDNKPYDQMARSLIASEGVWTTNPEVNFITATLVPMKGVDESKLTARVSRAFLGVRMDCVECHDGKLDNPWKQTDFHQMASFFGSARVALTGVSEDAKLSYEYRYLRKKEAEPVPAVVPWHSELLPDEGKPRERLARWITADENRPFARATVNRVWALLFNKPLVEPVDDIPLEGPFPPGLEILADDFTAHGCDLRRLFRVIASTRVFQLASQAADPDQPLSAEAEAHWAAFPMTRLRPEQMAGSVIQAASLATLDEDTSVFFRIKRGADVANFVKRYGDTGEDDFEDQSATIPQRLLLMNGTLVREHTQPNALLAAGSRIALLAPGNSAAVEAAYLAVLTRRPTAVEAEHFTAMLGEVRGNTRAAAMSDLCWTLLNSTEFSWNH